MTDAPLQSLKSWVRSYLERLPNGFGFTVLKLYSLLKLKVQFAEFKKLQFERKEAKRILTAIRNEKINKVVVVYDNLVSPPTYGDFFYVVMLARYFATRDIAVHFVIVVGAFREDWAVLDDIEKQRLVSHYLEMASALLSPFRASTDALSWSGLQALLRHEGEDNVVVPFCERVKSRRQIYGSSFNTLNYLCSQSSSAHLDRFLLTFEELAARTKIHRPDKPYVTLHCRYSPKWATVRNASDEEFLQIHARMRLLYPEHDLMVISDIAGCSHFRELARDHRLACQFSKDYSETFMGDGALILGGRFHFTLRGGGIDAIPMFSRNAYEYFATYGNERAWHGTRANSWSGQHQIFNNIRWSSRLFLPTGVVVLDTPARRHITPEVTEKSVAPARY